MTPLDRLAADALTVLDRVRLTDGGVALRRSWAGSDADAVAKARLLRRWAIAALLDHPAAVRVLAVRADDIPPCVVLADDDSRPTAALRPEDLAALAGVLRHAHAFGIAHGNLSTGAVAVGRDGVARLDFTAPADGAPEDDQAAFAALARRFGPGTRVVDAPGDLDVTRVADDAPSPAPAAKTPDRLGRFRLLDLLGRGGMGEVWRAVDPADGASVAIKTLLPEWAERPEMLARFLKEARLLAEVEHPNVAALREVNSDAGRHYLVVEYVPGGSLADLIESRPALPEKAALALMADVCRGLAAAHGRGIVHRDIKPENVLMVGDASEWIGGGETPPSPLAKLADFGLARHAVESESLSLTRTGAVLGTPFYLSPEQCAGGPLTPASDVYALGVTLFRLVAGRLPFVGETAVSLIHQHCHAPIPDLRALNRTASEAVASLVAKMLAKEPARRHADAAEVLADVETLLRGEPLTEAAHPRLPVEDESKVVRYDFNWELDASPAELWPHVSDTERLNRAIGLPAIDWRTAPDEAGKVRRHGRIRKMGVEAAWEEHPFEWIEGRKFGVLRQCSAGPFKWLLSIVELAHRPGGGTTLTHRFRVEPTGILGRTFAAVELGVKTRRNLGRVYQRIDAVVRSRVPTADPFEEPTRLGRIQSKTLESGLDRLARRGVDPSLVESLGDFIRLAPAQEVARIRPLALARRLDRSPDAMVAACLQATREGLLVMMWDLLCPLCRVPSEAVPSLEALREHGSCKACDLSYELDFANSVEMIFRAHPSIRDAETGVFCIGGPAHSPHVVAQVRLSPGERFKFDATLAPGGYRLRGPQLPRSLDFRAEEGAYPSRLDADVASLPEPTRVAPVVRAGAVAIYLENSAGAELVIRLERTTSRDDAVTAAKAATLALFRELFPREVLSPGRLVRIAAVALVRTELVHLRSQADILGEARSFDLLQQHLSRLESLAAKHGGTLVKAVGDGGLAAFTDPQSARTCAEELFAAGATMGLRAAVHHGPALAVTVNGVLDYFGVVSRQVEAVLSAAEAGECLLTAKVVGETAEEPTRRVDVPGMRAMGVWWLG